MLSSIIFERFYTKTKKDNDTVTVIDSARRIVTQVTAGGSTESYDEGIRLDRHNSPEIKSGNPIDDDLLKPGISVPEYVIDYKR